MAANAGGTGEPLYETIPGDNNEDAIGPAGESVDREWSNYDNLPVPVRARGSEHPYDTPDSHGSIEGGSEHPYDTPDGHGSMEGGSEHLYDTPDGHSLDVNNAVNPEVEISLKLKYPNNIVVSKRMVQAGPGKVWSLDDRSAYGTAIPAVADTTAGEYRSLWQRTKDRVARALRGGRTTGSRD